MRTSKNQKDQSSPQLPQAMWKLRRNVLQSKQLRRVLYAEVIRRASLSNPQYRQDLFAQQLAFINDKSSPLKAACCSRRAGKSHVAAIELIEACEQNPGTMSVYIGLTRKSAKRIIWNVFKKLKARYALKFEMKEADLEIVFENGSQIFIYGANDEGVAETLRGNPYKKVVIDEVASYRGHITELIDDILIPALVDLRGTITLIGTPSADFASFFYAVTHGKEAGWAVHHWTMFDNPHIPDPQAFLDDLKKRRKWTDDNPKLLREYYGKWARSNDEFAYKFNPLINVYAELPKFKMEYVLGLDLGYNDATAVSILGFNREYSDEVYVVESVKQSKLIPSRMAKLVRQMAEKYDPIRMVADCGGLGKAIVEEMRQRHNLPLVMAEKNNKIAYIELMNSDMQEGKIKVSDDNPVIEEWYDVTLEKTSQGRVVENPAIPNDVSDSVLYAWRECKHFFHEPKKEGPKPGTKEYFDKIEADIIKQAQLKLMEGFDEYDGY